jgi:hypothetical protein
VRANRPHAVAPGIESRFGRAELQQRLAAVDLVATDIDECLFPGFSQAVLGQMILYRLLTRPHTLGDLRLVPQLVSGGAYVRGVRLRRRLGWSIPENTRLMRRYEQSMAGIPEAYFRAGARTIPDRSFAGARRSLALLGRRAAVGLISFGIHLIAEEYMRQLNAAAEQPYVLFAEANPIAFDPGPDGRPAFTGYRCTPRTQPRHKREALEQRMAEHGARYPLILGHGPDEIEMVALARKRGGLSIAFRPIPIADPHFDVVVRAPDWRPLARLLAELL